MAKKIIESRIGRTPLIRAKKLEEKLGVSKIYLKLEGNNPSGHREDRLAYLIIKEAIAKGKETLCMGTYGIVAGSLAFLSQFFNIKCVFYVPKGQELLRSELYTDNIKIIEYGDSYEECIKESRKASKKNNWFDANVGLENNVMNMCAFSVLSNEILRQTHNKVETIFTQTNNGSSVSGLHLGMKQNWISGKIKDIPAIYGVSTASGNAIINCYEHKLTKFVPIGDLEYSIIKSSKYNNHLMNNICQNGQDALNAIYDTNGKAIGVTDEELLNAYDLINDNLDEIHVSISHSFPLAAFIKEKDAGNIKEGSHVIILNDGMVDIDIRQIEEDDNLPLPLDQFSEILHEWLSGYRDPVIEIEEAILNAREKGFILCAFQDNELVGAVIIVSLGFERFATKYHLAYIATEGGLKGMGIGTQLLHEAIEITEGNLSLHVDIDNDSAIKLYEKMGFQKPYYRMIHRSKSH